MFLEARSPSCFSDVYVLKLDGRPCGQFRGRWFSEDIDVQLVGRRSLHFTKTGWWGSRLVLLGDGDKVLGVADRAGFWTSAWDLTLSIGEARLVSEGMFNRRYAVLQGERQIAVAGPESVCSGDWGVEGQSPLQLEDVVFVGLIFHTIVRRNAAAASGATVSTGA